MSDTLLDAFDDITFQKMSSDLPKEAADKSVVSTEPNPIQIDLVPPHLDCVPHEMRNDPLLSDAGYLELCALGMFTEDAIDKLLACLGRTGGYSDLIIASGEMIYRKKSKRLMPLIGRKLTPEEVKDVAEYMFGPDRVAGAFSADSDIDESYEYHFDNTKLPMRARVNVCTYQPEQKRVLKMVLRDIPPVPPSYDDYNIPQLIRDHACGKDGLVAIAGQTGSGKTTTSAAIIRALKEDTENYRVILTYEKPIEFSFKNVKGPNLVLPHTIGEFGDFSSFYMGLVNALRNTPEVIFVGESREKETFETLPKIAESGHLGITTLHARSLANIFTRIANEIGPDRAEGVVRQTIQYMRLGVYQELVKTFDGKQVCLYEILPFTREVKEKILAQKYEDFTQTIEALIQEHGISLKQSADNALKDGLISEADYRNVIY